MVKPNIQVRQFASDDWPAVAEIYRQGMETGMATFEHQVPSKEHWIQSHVLSCSLVACSQDEIIGFATLSPFSSRYVYRGVAELSLYVAKAWHGKGVGSLLMAKLIETSERCGFWTLQAKIFPENEASIKLHRKFGFRQVGIFEKIGKTHKGVWKDNIFMERRSKVVGIDS